ncbi:MAG TPA: energy transducer TonB [Mediterranea massiliensis]|uniref:Energy transducer TonB n=1 Tax=Mediterranea massiliensis TaxID=1841865 RepID=A0A921LC23_9BACT|nr:energy transducer TonB [Mediterranea massiliensis]MBM6733809.1 energy transducer TonB [Mediterranea massiliensis]CCZ47512.1 tonB-dependent receptor [Bacteroides sp. CAG:661]HJF92351.1 energy transducer TonB [Mediterranea massiliensis]
MEVKKSPKADLENKRSTWLLVGYVIVLAFMFIAFEWTKRDVKIDTSQAVADLVFEEEIEIPITEQPEQATPPPPPEAPAVVESLTIVDDDMEVESTEIASSEETGQAVEIAYVPPTVEEEEVVEQEIFEVVEQMPEFPNGGMAGLMQYLSKNIKYPTIAQENGTQGRVTVQFVVNADGSIVDAKVIRGVDPYLDKEALRVINSMPKWKPGMQRGKAVRVKYTVPVMFRLQ